MIQEQKRFFVQQIQHERDLLFQTVNAQEHERERIAGELHDSVGNKLNLLSMWINHRSQFPPEQYEDLIRKELSDVLDATRNISHQLFPTRIEIIGFIPSLDEILSKLSLDYHLELKWPQKNLSFGFEKEIQVYRVVQELLSNIVKHSQATTIFLYVRSNKQALQLIVGDNGKGFDKTAVKTGMGLKNIESRLQSINAQSKWKIHPEKSVRLIIHIPYDNQ